MSRLEILVKRADIWLEVAEHSGRSLAGAIHAAQMAQRDYKTVASSAGNIPPGTEGAEASVRRAMHGVAFSYQLLASLWHKKGVQDFDARTGGLEAKARKTFENCLESCDEAIKAFKIYKASFTTEHELANRKLRLAEVYALAVDVLVKFANDDYAKATRAVGQNGPEPGRKFSVLQLMRIGLWMENAKSYSETVLKIYSAAEREGIVLQPNSKAQAGKLATDINGLAGKIVAAETQRYSK